MLNFLTDKKFHPFMKVAAVGLALGYFSPLISMGWWIASGVFGVVILAIALISKIGFAKIDMEYLYMGFWMILAGGLGFVLAVGVMLAMFKGGLPKIWADDFY